MDESLEEVELLSTLVPKPIKTYKEVKKKAPSKLALKRTLRRSSMYDRLLHSVQNSQIVTVDAPLSEEYSDTAPSSTTSLKDVNDSIGISQKNEIKAEAPIIIIESTSEEEPDDNVEHNDEDIIPGTAENSIADSNKPVLTKEHLSETKLASIKSWVNNIGAHDKASNIKQASNSTFALDKTCLPFDEWIRDTYKNDKKSEQVSTPRKKDTKSEQVSTPIRDDKENVNDKQISNGEILKKTSTNHILKDKSFEENEKHIKLLVDTNSEKIPNKDMKLIDFCDKLRTNYVKTDTISDEIEKRKAKNDFLFDQLKQQVANSAKKKENNEFVTLQWNNLDEYEKDDNKHLENILTTPNITKRKPRTKKGNDIEYDNNNKDELITPAKQMISNKDEISNLLDKFYGNSWHKNKDEILSVPKPRKQININKLKQPHTEKKKPSNGLLDNSYLNSERIKSQNLLKSLHKARIDAKEASPFFARPKYVDDDTPSPSPGLISDSEPEETYVYRKTKKTALPKPVQLVFNDNATPVINKKPSKKPTYRKIHIFSSDSDSDTNFTPSVSNTRRKKSPSSNASSNSNSTRPTRNRITSKSNNPTAEVANKLQNIALDINTPSRKIKIFSSGNATDYTPSNPTSNHKSSVPISKRVHKSKSEKQNIAPEKKTPYRNIKTFSSSSDSDYTPSNHTSHRKPTTSSVPIPKRVPKSNTDKPTEDITDKLQNVTLDSSSSSGDDDVFIKPQTPVVKSKEPKQLSFLSSLSKNIPDEKCDPSALIYKKNYKVHREALGKKLFDLFNERIFNKCIPNDTPIEWSARMTGTAGFCSCLKKTHRDGKITRCVRLQLSSKVLDSADRLRDTLVHEMCHAATFIVNQISDGHGSFWKTWASKAMQMFPELPPIRRCHDYDINYKYTYKCMSCSYSFGRHSKSLNLEKKRCGYCYGQFEVLINKTSRSGDKKSVPCTPNKVTGFAKYVKENYALHKSPGVNHADLMRLLGKRYQESKSGTV